MVRSSDIPKHDGIRRKRGHPKLSHRLPERNSYPPSISTEEAVLKLRNVLYSALDDFSKKAQPFTMNYLRLGSYFLLAFISGERGSLQFTIISISLLVLIILEEIVGRRIHSCKMVEISNRLNGILEELIGKSMEYGEVKEPPSRAINLIRVRRDNQWRLLPVNLLVAGDTIQVSPGDDLGVECKKRCSLETAGEIMDVLETPVKRQLDMITKVKPKSSIWQNESNSISIALYFFGVSVCVFSICLRIIPFSKFECEDSIIFALVTIYFLSSPLWEALFFCFGTARIISLTEVLQKSKTPYLEAEDVDEFDEEAPPPTKDIYLNPLDIIRTIKKAFKKGGAHEFLFWQVDLVDVFASVSVLSFLDREGPIANSFPLPLEVMLPSPIKEGDLAFGEFILNPVNSATIRTNYADGSVSDNDMKALGLSLMVSSSCGLHKSQFRRDWHLRFPWNTHPGRKLNPVFRTCTCSIAREVGFHSRAAENYNKISDFWITRDVDSNNTSLNSVEYQGLFSRIFTDQSKGDFHMFSFGDLTSTSNLSSYTWNSKKIQVMTDGFCKKLIELDENLAASDLQCIGLTYKPILLDRSEIPIFKEGSNLINLTSPASNQHFRGNVTELVRRHIFLGALISGYEPKEDMQELIDDLENSGIRFVYFSPYSECITKAFGDRLGLETDWNSCIILSKKRADSFLDLDAASNFTDSKSKLPRGVHNIRPHLAKVDDIPLHLSLFAECDPFSIVEMHRIYSENEEVVICVGSTLNWTNTKVFQSASTSIGMEPPNIRSTLKSKRMSSIHLSAALTSLTCPIILPFDCSPYVLTEIIREARCQSRGRRTATMYRFSLSFSLFFTILTTNFTFTLVIIVIVMSILLLFAFLFPPYEPEILKLMPKKIWDSKGGARKLQCLYQGIRSTWNSLCLLYLLQFSIIDCPPLVCTIWSVTVSVTSLHDYLSILTFGPAQHTIWFLTVVPITILITIGSIILRGDDDIPIVKWVNFFIQVLIVSILNIGGNELVKSYWRVEALKHEKRAKLQFNTKLGMHSPI